MRFCNGCLFRVLFGLSVAASLSAQIKWLETKSAGGVLRGEGLDANVRSLYESDELVCREVKSLLRSNWLGYFVVVADARFKIDGPREFDSGGYELWVRRQSRGRQRSSNHSVLEIVATRGGCRLRLKEAGRQVERRLLFEAGSDSIDMLLLRHLEWVWVFPGVQGGGMDAARLFLRTEVRLKSSAGMSGDFTAQRIRMVVRTDGCFGDDSYYPWFHPFNEDAVDCPLREADASRSQVCTMLSRLLSCEE